MVVIDGRAVPECPQLKLLRMEGSVYFAAAAHVSDRLHGLRVQPEPARHLLVMTKSMNFIDDAGAQLWEQEHQRRLAMGGDLYFHRPRPEVLQTWQRRGFIDKLGPGHVFDDKRTAIATIVPRLDGAVCARCTARVFEECARQPGPPAPSAAP
jgi:SulP family sulfate permease